MKAHTHTSNLTSWRLGLQHRRLFGEPSYPKHRILQGYRVCVTGYQILLPVIGWCPLPHVSQCTVFHEDEYIYTSSLYQGKCNVSERVQDTEMNYWGEKFIRALMQAQAGSGDNSMAGAPRSVQAPETEPGLCEDWSQPMW